MMGPKEKAGAPAKTPANLTLNAAGPTGARLHTEGCLSRIGSRHISSTGAWTDGL